jgi:sugar lactone lactonase YvrE
MYTSDTPNAVIYRTPLDEQGEPGKREVFRRFQPGEGIPDGAAMDVEGCYWSAMFDGWRIARFHRRVSSWKSTDAGALPDDGLLWRADMKTLYITTTRENMDDDEVAQYPLSAPSSPCRWRWQG